MHMCIYKHSDIDISLLFALLIGLEKIDIATTPNIFVHLMRKYLYNLIGATIHTINVSYIIKLTTNACLMNNSLRHFYEV